MMMQPGGFHIPRWPPFQLVIPKVIERCRIEDAVLKNG